MNIAIIITQYLALGIVLLYTLPFVCLYIRCIVHDRLPNIENWRTIAWVFSLLVLYIFGFPVPYHG